MRILVVIVVLFNFICVGQDRLFLKDGSTKKVIVTSIGSDFVFYKTTDTSFSSQKISKSELLLLEKFDGKIYIFSTQEKIKEAEISENKAFFRKSIGLQPFNVFLGRLTATYEYLNKKGAIGFVIPLSLTFDPVGVIYNIRVDSTTRKTKHRTGINFIGGADVNFYLGKGDYHGFFIGPRFRYGTDMFLSNIEAYTLQTQFGWRLSSAEDRLSQHISVGFGFARILSSQAGARINPKQSYGWLSFNYRIGVNW